jgi:hypothetical protein
MSRVVTVLVVLGILAVVGGAFAAGHVAKTHTPKVHTPKVHTPKAHTSKAEPTVAEGPMVISGDVVAVKTVSGSLKSFVLERPDTVPVKERKVTVTVGDDTTYTLLGKDGASTDVAKGATILVRLSAPLAKTTGEASVVRVKHAAPPAKVAHVKEPKPKKEHPKKEHAPKQPKHPKH